MPRDDDIQLRHGTAAEWATANPLLALGEPGTESDTHLMKVGPGHWNDLPYTTGNAQTGSAYIKPAGGIPSTDLTTTVQSELGLASSATQGGYVKPGGGIPSTDLSSAVQTGLGLAGTALQTAPVTTVATRTGNVVLTKGDVGLGSVDNTSDANKPISSATSTALGGKQATLGFTPENTSNKNVAGGYAGLDPTTGLVPGSLLPGQQASVQPYANLAAFPGTGAANVIYVAADTGFQYLWAGSPANTYTRLSASPGSTDAVPEGTTNLYYTDVRAAAAAPVQSVAGRAGAVTLAKGDVGLANVDNTTDINKPISSATQTALNAKADGSATTTALAGKADASATTSALAGKQPLDSDLTAIAGLTPTDNDFLQRKSGAWVNRTPTQAKADLAIAESDVVGLVSDLALKAPLASPTLTGTVTVPTPTTPTGATTRLYIDGQGLAQSTRGTSDIASSSSPVTQRTLKALSIWLQWLEDNSALGAITEVGWPSTNINLTNLGEDCLHWNPVAEVYLTELDPHDVWLMPFMDFDGSGHFNFLPGWSPGGGVSGTNAQFGLSSAPLLRHARMSKRGYVINAGPQGDPPSRIGFGAHITNSGIGYGGFQITQTVTMADQSTYNLIAAGGFTIVRVQCQWEELQATVGGTLVQAGMDRLDTQIQMAINAGLQVIIDVHNYAGLQYWRYGTTTATALGTAVAVGGSIPYNTSDANLTYNGNATFPTSGSFEIYINNQIATVHKSGSNLVIDTLYNGNTTLTWVNAAPISTYRYKVGDPFITAANFADLWTKIATYYKQGGKAALLAGIAGYELMNEPSKMHANLSQLAGTTLTANASSVTIGSTLTVGSTASFPGSGSFGIIIFTPGAANPQPLTVHVTDGTTLTIDFITGAPSYTSGQIVNSPQKYWETASQAAVTAIRAVDTTVTILVPGYNYSSIPTWRNSHPVGWITDPNTNFRYVGHHYWSGSSNGSSAYDIPWATEESRWAAGGSNYGGLLNDPPNHERTVGVSNRMRPFVGGQTLDRVTATNTLSTMVSGTLYLSHLLAEYDQTWTNLQIAVRTAGSSDPTVARLGLYEVLDDATFLLLGSLSHNTALFSTSSFAMTPSAAMNVPVNVKRGRPYAIGALVVGGTTKPVLQGNGSFPNQFGYPRLSWTKTGLSDLPTYVVPTTAFNEIFYGITT